MATQRIKVKLSLKEVQNPGPRETHVYETEDKRTVSLTSGTAAWTWTIQSECPILKRNGKAICNAYVEQGIKQHEYKGGFKEAISILSVNMK